MIKAKSLYDKERVIKMSKRIQVKTLSVTIILSSLILAMGIFNIVSSLIGEKTNVLSLILGIVICVFSLYPVYNAIKGTKGIVEKTIKDMDVEDGQVIMEYTFKDRKAEISVTKNEEVKLCTLMLKNLAYVKLNKDGLALYLTNNDMYFIENTDFTLGNRQGLINLLRKNNVQIK